MNLPVMDMADISRKLQELQSTWPELVIATADERNLPLSWGTEFPAIYLLKQSCVSTTPGNTSSRVIRQLYNVQLDLVVVTQRFVDGNSLSLLKKDINDAVYDLLTGWTPPACDMALDLLSYIDGDPSDPIQYALHKYHTKLLKQKVLS